jgi:hypothetical protein
LSSDLFRDVSAALIMVFGIIMLSAPLAARIATIGGFVGNLLDRKFGSAARTGVGGQFGTGNGACDNTGLDSRTRSNACGIQPTGSSNDLFCHSGQEKLNEGAPRCRRRKH